MPAHVGIHEDIRCDEAHFGLPSKRSSQSADNLMPVPLLALDLAAICTDSLHCTNLHSGRVV